MGIPGRNSVFSLAAVVTIVALVLMVLPMMVLGYNQREDEDYMDDFLSGYQPSHKTLSGKSPSHSRLPLLMELLRYMQGSEDQRVVGKETSSSNKLSRDSSLTSLNDLISRYKNMHGTSVVPNKKTPFSQLLHKSRENMLLSDSDVNNDDDEDAESNKVLPLLWSKRGIQGHFGASPPLYELCRMMGMPGCY